MVIFIQHCFYRENDWGIEEREKGERKRDRKREKKREWERRI
jgi:hypothetical protein